MTYADDRRVLGSGRHLTLVSDSGWEYVKRRGSTGVVAIVAVTDDSKLLLVEQYRPAVGRRVIDLPAGLVGDEAEQASERGETAARRELLEETGYRTDGLSRLVETPTSPGLTSEIVTFFLAKTVEKVDSGGGVGSEQIVVHEIPLKAIDDWLSEQIDRNVLIDVKVYAGLRLLSQFGL